MIECAAFVMMSLPMFCIPCVIAMADLPTFQGVTGRQLALIPTIVVEAPPGWVSPDAASTTPSLGGSVRTLAGRSRSQSGRTTAAQAAAQTAAMVAAQEREAMGMGMQELPMCAVCMEDHVPGSRVKKLPCGHMFVSVAFREVLHS
ncbi:hypothetical protein M427DRAFT_454576 [Gonapodya prolifera JEL478]|uniref:Uncharacterized protein n=1 Tax=Gonapodya prolifera (strain JEL478) TaxID=1344416 RepID=A0A139AS90_GONPJ|nr:hypothetical protein M427DRAFT_454576 [Gonapodya prolifera JEL478]|eukprot:KXS19621.1 hypothetical protein M427DRAFT_454576 [Gonapodya prolifera JEL478]